MISTYSNFSHCEKWILFFETFLIDEKTNKYIQRGEERKRREKRFYISIKKEMENGE